MSERRPDDDIPEGNCRTCGLRPTHGWDCLGWQFYNERPGGITHPGKCWAGRYPDDTQAQALEEDRETEKQRQAEERRPTQMQLSV